MPSNCQCHWKEEPCPSIYQLKGNFSSSDEPNCHVVIGSIAAHPLSGVRLFILPLKGVGGNISKLSPNLKMVAIHF